LAGIGQAATTAGEVTIATKIKAINKSCIRIPFPLQHYRPSRNFRESQAKALLNVFSNVTLRLFGEIVQKKGQKSEKKV
jgi:hypothetical protein